MSVVAVHRGGTDGKMGPPLEKKWPDLFGCDRIEISLLVIFYFFFPSFLSVVKDVLGPRCV